MFWPHLFPLWYPRSVQQRPVWSSRRRPGKHNIIVINWSESIQFSNLVTESRDAGRAIRKDIRWLHRKACLVYAHATTALTCIRDYIAHAALQPLGLTVWHALAISTLTALLTGCPVSHSRRFGAFGMGSSTTSFLFAGRILGVAALHSWSHELAVLTTRWVFVAAHSTLGSAQLAVFVAARVVVLSAKQPGIALLIALYSQVAAEGLLRLREAPAWLGLKNLAYGAKRAWREFLRKVRKQILIQKQIRWVYKYPYLIVYVVPANRVGVHEEAAALRGTGRAFGDVWIVLWAPVVSKLVSRHQIRLAGDNPLSVMVAGTAQTRVQI